MYQFQSCMCYQGKHGDYSTESLLGLFEQQKTGQGGPEGPTVLVKASPP